MARKRPRALNGLEEPLAGVWKHHQDADVELPIEHRDVTTIMALLGDIKDDVHAIRILLEGNDGEEELPEVDS